jgi:hypothetical protein
MFSDRISQYTSVDDETTMAYEVHHQSNGRYEIRSSSGRTSHIVRQNEETWTVDEDHYQRVFPTRADALDCARELAGDADLRALTQI